MEEAKIKYDIPVEVTAVQAKIIDTTCGGVMAGPKEIDGKIFIKVWVMRDKWRVAHAMKYGMLGKSELMNIINGYVKEIGDIREGVTNKTLKATDELEERYHRLYTLMVIANSALKHVNK